MTHGGIPPVFPPSAWARLAVVAAVAVLVATAVAGCGDVVVQHGGQPDAPLGPSVDLSTASPFPSLAGAPPAAAVTALQLNGPAGDEERLGSLLGRTATVLAFWQTSCPPCAAELPALQAIEPALSRQGVRLLLVDLQEDAGTVRSWAAAHGVGLPLYRDGDGSAHDALGLLAVPTTAVLGPQGAVVSRLEGAADVAGLATVLRSMGISTQ